MNQNTQNKYIFLLGFPQLEIISFTEKTHQLLHQGFRAMLDPSSVSVILYELSQVAHEVILWQLCFLIRKPK